MDVIPLNGRSSSSRSVVLRTVAADGAIVDDAAVTAVGMLLVAARM